MKRYQWLLLLLILLLGAVLRWTGIAWDSYQHYHPDERYITWVGTTIETPTSLADAFRPETSSFNPFYWPPDAESEGIVVLEDERRDFAYGHLPLYLGVAATRLAEALAPALRPLLPEEWLVTQEILNSSELVEFNHMTAVTRALTGLVDLLTVSLTFFLGRRLYGVGTGLLAAAFLALNVMHIQLAHFFAVDPYLTLFVVLTLYALILTLAQMRRPGGRPFPFLALAAVAIGLAVSSKFSAILLFLPLALTLWLDPGVTEQRFTRRLLAAGGIAFLTFALANPFALLDWGCEVITPPVEIGPLTLPAVNWGSCYLENIAQQSAMVGGDAAFPFTLQYTGTLPYLYPVVMQLRWGMGLLLGVAAFTGFVWAVWRGGRAAYRAWRRYTGPITFHSGEWVLLAWTVPYFLITGGFFVKFMRYLQPVTPFLMIYAAALLLALPWRRLRAFVVGLVLIGTSLYAFSFVNMYSLPHPWVSASIWLQENAASGSLILDEKWDEALPSSVIVDGELRSRFRFDGATLNWLGGVGSQDDGEKLRDNLALLAQADYVTVASNRGYGVVARLPELYPLSSQYYHLLFSGELGYEPVYVSGRSPRLGPLSLWPDRFEHARITPPPTARAFLEAIPRLSLGYADESFTVYDQPLVIVFANTGRLSLEEMLAQFEFIDEG